jgi:predicted NUDIX family NTP pyrophosphohydrolase
MLKSNLCEIEWPPKSGRKQLIPEADRAEWFSLQDAQSKILAGQRPFLDRLESALKSG